MNENFKTAKGQVHCLEKDEYENFKTAKGQVHCLEKDELNITVMHRLFGEIRCSLDINHYRLEQIIKVLCGTIGIDEPVSQMPDPPPHLCSLSSNLDIIRGKIDEETELIGKIYNALGMDPEEKY